MSMNKEYITRVAVIEEDYARDTQIFIGTAEEAAMDIWASDSWVDVKHPSLFLGIFRAECEEVIRNKLAAQLCVLPSIITLYEPEADYWPMRE